MTAGFEDRIARPLRAMTQSEHFRRFAALRVPGDPLILYNAWDAGSAGVVAKRAQGVVGSAWSPPANTADGRRCRSTSRSPMPRGCRRGRVAGDDRFRGAYAVEPAGVAADLSWPGWRHWLNFEVRWSAERLHP